MSNKGQISFETLLVMMVVITITASIMVMFIGTQDTTNAYLIIRSELLTQTNSMSGVIVEQVFIGTEETPTFYVRTIPNTLSAGDFNLTIIKQKVVEKTNFSEIEIKINE